MAPSEATYVLRIRRATPFEADLGDPASGALLAEARETTPPLLRLAASALARAASGTRHALPWEVRVGGLGTLRRGLSLLRPEIEVRDAEGRPLGRLRQRLWANAGGFDVLDAGGTRLGALRAEEDGRGFVVVDRRGASLARTAPSGAPDECRLGLAPEVEADPDHRALLLAALCALPRILAG